jgi:hypothetical protein
MIPAIPSGSYLAEGFGTTSNLLEVRSELGSGDGRGPSVDLDRHVLIAAQADLAVSIDFH